MSHSSSDDESGSSSDELHRRDKQPEDCRPSPLRREFSNRKEAVEAVKWYYVKEHHKTMVQDRKRTSGMFISIKPCSACD